MSARMTNPFAVLPQANKAIGHLQAAMAEAGVSPTLRELICLRASQINGCAACVYGHIDALRKGGEGNDRIDTVAVWRESPFFTDVERAALGLAEAATRLADAPGVAVPDDVWNEAADHFDEKELAGIILAVATINLFNRVNVTIKEPAGMTWA